MYPVEDVHLGLLQWKCLVTSTGERTLFDKIIFLPNTFSFPPSSYTTISRSFVFYAYFKINTQVDILLSFEVVKILGKK